MGASLTHVTIKTTKKPVFNCEPNTNKYNLYTNQN